MFVIGSEDAHGATSFDGFVNNNFSVPKLAFDGSSDLACLPFSSGTTGLAKVRYGMVWYYSLFDPVFVQALFYSSEAYVYS